MIAGLTVILVCQLCGEAIVRGFGWPVPGPVLGMLFLFAALSLRDRFGAPAEGGPVEATAKVLLANLSLLFVPAGAGVVQRLDVLKEHGTGLAIALVVSTVLTLLVTVVTFLAVSRWYRSDSAAEADG
jgi:holin-like protein